MFKLHGGNETNEKSWRDRLEIMLTKKKEELHCTQTQGSIVTPGGPEETPGNDNDDADDGGQSSNDDDLHDADQVHDADQEHDDGAEVELIDTPAATKAKKKATNTSLQSVNNYDTL